MKKKLLKALALTLLCISANLNAQNELWYFGGWNLGGQTGLKFTGVGNSPTGANSQSARAYYEGCTVVSDGSGNVLFYSDGVYVYNKNHVKMGGGVMLRGGQADNNGGWSSSSAQGALSMPVPGNPNQYYLFTMEDVTNPVPNGFRYNIIDMTLNGGLGDFVQTDVVICDGVNQKCTEAMTAVAKSCDTTWVLTHVGASNQFAVYPVSAGGIGTPVISAAGPVIPNKNDGGRGTLALSPSGNLLGMAYGNGMGAWIFNFDKKTGIVSSSTFGPNGDGQVGTLGYYGSEWSPDGYKFYYSDQSVGNTGIHQFNILTGALTTVAASGHFGEMVLGRDGKIYVGKETSINGYTEFQSHDLAVIATPNAATGGAAGFSVNGYSTGNNGEVWLGLPQTYFPRFDTITTKTKITPVAAKICDSTSAFYLTATPAFGSWSSKPSGFVNAQGLFNPGLNNSDSTVVKVYFGQEPCIELDSITITVKSCCSPLGTNAPSAPICPGDSINLSSLVTAGTGTWSIGLTPPPAVGKTNATISSPWFKTKLNANPGDYTIVFTLSNAGAGCPDTTQEHVTVKPAPNNAPVKTFSFCAGDSVQISGAAGAYSYVWTPAGETSVSKYAKSAGNYYLTTTNNSNACISKDTIVVTQKALPTTTPIDTSVCAGGSVNISVPVAVSYLWDNATTGQSTNISTTGKHWVIVENNQNCKDTIFVQVNAGAPLNVSLNNPPNSCAGGSATLTATVTGIQTAPLTYEWDNVAGGASKVYNTGGTYTVEVTDARNCKGTDNATFSISPSPTVDLPADTSKCFTEGQKYTVSIPDTFNTIKWNGTLSTDTFYTAATAGTITVIVTNIGGCADTASIVLTEKCTELKWDFPNVFTPNGDGKNDHFYPFWVTNETLGKLKKVHFEVYDRWGILMYKNENIAIPEWDGKFNGNAVSPGVYYWIVKWTDTANNEGERTGWVQVIFE